MDKQLVENVVTQVLDEMRARPILWVYRTDISIFHLRISSGYFPVRR
jgi:hypothetical protein